MVSLVLFNTHDLILLITVYQCLALGLALFLMSRPQLKSGLFVMLFFLMNAAIPLDTLISFGAAFHDYAIEKLPDWFYVFEMGYWLEGPFLLWYLRSLAYKNYRLGLRDLWYLLPCILFFIHQLLAYHSLPTVSKVFLEKNHNLSTESVSVFYLVLLRNALRVYFGVLCLQELRSYFVLLHQKYATVNSASFVWIKILVYGFFALWVVGLFIAIALIANNHFGTDLPIAPIGLFSNYAVCLLMGAVLVALNLRAGHFEQMEYSQQEKAAQTFVPNPADIELLDHAMQVKKLYLNSELTLESLAKALSFSPRHLSQLINRQYKCSFFELINRLRVEEAKRLMLDTTYQHLSILDIMFQVGFNSKTTFNSCFKKQTGLTPRDYKKQQTVFDDAPVNV